MLMETNKKKVQSTNRVIRRYTLRNIWKYIIKFFNAEIIIKKYVIFKISQELLLNFTVTETSLN